jgi:hypothetical protein
LVLSTIYRRKNKKQYYRKGGIAMRKKALVLILTAMVLCALASLAEARVFNWTKEGVSPFWHQSVQTDGELKDLFRSQAFKNKLATGIGMEMARAAETSVLNNQAAKTAYPSGTEFDWMLYGPGATPKEINNTVRWSGDHDLVGFVIPLGQEAIFIGSRCVNILKPRIVKSEIPGEYIERTQMQKKVVVQQQQQEEEEEIVVVQQPQPRKKIIYVYVQAPADYSENYSRQGYNNDSGCYNNNGYGSSGCGSGFPLPPPPPIFGGYNSGGYGYSGGFGGGGSNFGRSSYGRSGRGGGQSQPINIVNTNTNTSSSSSYSRASGGRVNFNSSINNRQGMSNRQSSQRRSQNCPTGNCGSGQPARR